MFKVQFETGNDAFADDLTGAIAEILADIGNRIEDGETEGQVLDPNGNYIGNWELAAEGPPDEPSTTEPAPIDE